VLIQAAEFAQYGELVASTDPTNPKFGEFLDNKLKSGAAVQCMP